MRVDEVFGHAGAHQRCLGIQEYEGIGIVPSENLFQSVRVELFHREALYGVGLVPVSYREQGHGYELSARFVLKGHGYGQTVYGGAEYYDTFTPAGHTTQMYEHIFDHDAQGHHKAHDHGADKDDGHYSQQRVMCRRQQAVADTYGRDYDRGEEHTPEHLEQVVRHGQTDDALVCADNQVHDCVHAQEQAVDVQPGGTGYTEKIVGQHHKRGKCHNKHIKCEYYPTWCGRFLK